MALFVNWHLLGDEKPIHECRVSWKMYGLYYLAGFFLLGIAGYLYFFLYDIAYVRQPATSIVLATIGFILVSMARWKSRKELVLLTTERLLIRKKSGEGMFKETNIEALAFNKIDDVQVHQTFLQKIFGMGDLHFRVSGQEHLLENMDNPQELERAIYRILEKEKLRDKEEDEKKG